MIHQHKCCDHSSTATPIITYTAIYDIVDARLGYIIKEYFEEHFHEHRCPQTTITMSAMSAMWNDFYSVLFVIGRGSICLFVKFSPIEVIYNFRVYN